MTSVPGRSSSRRSRGASASTTTVSAWPSSSRPRAVMRPLLPGPPPTSATQPVGCPGPEPGADGEADGDGTDGAAEDSEAAGVSGEISRAMPQPLPEETAAAGSLLPVLASCTMPAPSVPPSWASMRRKAPSDRETE